MRDNLNSKHARELIFNKHKKEFFFFDEVIKTRDK